MKNYRLYKYLPISTRSLSIISSGKVWYAKPKSFNDPFDCGLDLCGDMTTEEKIQVLGAEMKRAGWSQNKVTQQLQLSFTQNGELNQTATQNIIKLTDAIHQKRDSWGILSLSSTPRSVLMWSHYAAQHKGICIEFTVPMSESIHEVTYSSKVPCFTLHDIYVKRNAEFISLFITKHIHWKYEKEYRVLLDRGDILHDIPGPITAVIFGLNTPPVDEALVRKVADGLGNVRLRRCKREAGRFGVRIEKA